MNKFITIHYVLNTKYEELFPDCKTYKNKSIYKITAVNSAKYCWL